MTGPPPLSRQQMQQVVTKAREGLTIINSAKPMLARAGALGPREQDVLYEMIYAAERALGDAWGVFVNHRAAYYKAQVAERAPPVEALPPTKVLAIGYTRPTLFDSNG